MNKVRINDLARELEVKSRSILDALTAVGVTEVKTHSSSIEADEAEKVRNYLTKAGQAAQRRRVPAEAKPAFDLSNISKPGDAMKAILARRQAAEMQARSVLARPAAVAAVTAATAAKAGPGTAATTVKSAAGAAPAASTASAPTAATVVAPRRIVPQPRAQAPIVMPPSAPAIASKPPVGPVIAKPAGDGGSAEQCGGRHCGQQHCGSGNDTGKCSAQRSGGCAAGCGGCGAGQCAGD